jgi:hypothetical protein
MTRRSIPFARAAIVWMGFVNGGSGRSSGLSNDFTFWKKSCNFVCLSLLKFWRSLVPHLFVYACDTSSTFLFFLSLPCFFSRRVFQRVISRFKVEKLCLLCSKSSLAINSRRAYYYHTRHHNPRAPSPSKPFGQSETPNLFSLANLAARLL